MKLNLDNIKARCEAATRVPAHCKRCKWFTDLPACIKEIERLRKLVKSAHREGMKTGNGWSCSRDFDDTNTLRLMWEDSEARKALEKE